MLGPFSALTTSIDRSDNILHAACYTKQDNSDGMNLSFSWKSKELAGRGVATVIGCHQPWLMFKSPLDYYVLAPFRLFASSSRLGYDCASTNVRSRGCTPSFIARTSISSAVSIVRDVSTAAHNTP